jgi:hypothetical protein
MPKLYDELASWWELAPGSYEIFVARKPDV